MTTFTDGPAGGKTLMLRRAPAYLRVARNRYDEKLDALDQLGDTPAGAEDLFAYRLVKNDGSIHIRGGKKGPSGFFQLAEYAVCDPQPSEEVMRSTELWRQWCEAQGETK